MPGRLRCKDLALCQVQSLFLLLREVPEAELENSQARLFDGSGASDAYLKCCNCQQGFSCALELEMKRRFWWQGEYDAATQLSDEALNCAGNRRDLLSDAKIFSCAMMIRQKLEAVYKPLFLKRKDESGSLWHGNAETS